MAISRQQYGLGSLVKSIGKGVKKFVKSPLGKAAILGFSLFGRDHSYILDSENKININLLKDFLNKYKNEKFIIFGFTSNVYEHLIKNSDIKFPIYDFKNAILLHGGGWKKLEKYKISNKEFKKN